MPHARVAIVLGGLLAAVVLFFVFAPDESDENLGEANVGTTPPSVVEPDAATTETTQEDVTPETEPTPSVPLGSTTPDRVPDRVNIPITLEGGAPVGGVVRETVQQGRTVRVVVRSDTADEVHLHGYDITRDVGPNAPAVLVFTATIPGVFELEIHHGVGEIAQIRVEPRS